MTRQLSAAFVAPQPTAVSRASKGALADFALTGAARFWFLVLVIGQWIFAVYLLRFYGGHALQGDFAAWNKIFPSAHVVGRPVANFVIAMHCS